MFVDSSKCSTCRRDDTCVGTILSPGKSDESFVTISLLT